MFNLKENLAKDDKYKEILAACSEEERAHLEQYMETYLASWQTGLFDPLEKIINDKELSSAVGKELRKLKGE